MSSKNSGRSVEANMHIWKKNFPSSSRIKRDPSIPFTEDLSTLTRMPTNRQILGNFTFLFDSEKRQQGRIKIMIRDIELLWTNTLNFPLLSRALIRKKLIRLVDLFNKKRTSEKFTAVLCQLFDVTNVNGEWKCSEDKELYQRQIKSGGKVGYSTLKEAPLKSVHPRKRTRLTNPNRPSTSREQPLCNILPGPTIDSSPESSPISLSSASSSPEYEPKFKRASTDTACLLVRRTNISTKKAHDVLSTISEQGYDVPAPSQVGIWKRVTTEGQKMIIKIIEKLQNAESYCLQFDGKRLQGEEYQVVLLKNTETEIKLGVLKCENGSAKAIYKELRQLINEYNA